MILNQYRLLINDKEVMRGSQAELSQKLGVSRNSFYHAARGGHLLLETYRIEMLEPAPRKPKNKKDVVQKKKTPHQIKLEFLANHLKIYSNVASDFDPVPYFPDLYDLGYNCKCREVVIKERSRVSGRHRKRDVFYITECV